MRSLPTIVRREQRMADQAQIDSALQLSNQDLAYVVMDRLNLVDPTDMVALKTDNAREFLDELCDRLETTQKLYNDQLSEIQDMKDDLEHIYMAQRINGEPDETVEKTSHAVTDLVVLRRTVKDAGTATRIMLENFSRTRGFIRNMGSRAYTPKSKAFEDLMRVRAEVTTPKVPDGYRETLSGLYEKVSDMVKLRRESSETSSQVPDGKTKIAAVYHPEPKRSVSEELNPSNIISGKVAL